MISLEGLFFPSRWVAFETCREGMKKGQGAAWEREGGWEGGVGRGWGLPAGALPRCCFSVPCPCVCWGGPGHGTCPPW